MSITNMKKRSHGASHYDSVSAAWQSAASVMGYACITLGALYWVLGWWLGR